MNHKIKDICDVTSSRRIFSNEYVKSGIPFFRSQEIIELSMNGHTTPRIFISHNRYKKIKDNLILPQIGDILISAIGANRGYPWCINLSDFYFKDGNIIWLRNFKPFCNSKYLTYFLSTKNLLSYLKNSSEHSAQGAITLDIIKNIEINLPTIEEQQHIVGANRICYASQRNLNY